jgi:hypothetical protein
VHHFACLAGFGAEAIHPNLAFATLMDIRDALPTKVDEKELVKRYIKAIGKGLLKVMSKMGISTYQSYCGAQIFEAVGLSTAFVDKYFTGTSTAVEGRGPAQIAEETVRLHRLAYSGRAALPQPARPGRRVRLPHARRGAHVDAGLDRQAAARVALEQLLDLQGVLAPHQRAGREAPHAARPLHHPRRPQPRCRSRRSSPPRRS